MTDKAIEYETLSNQELQELLKQRDPSLPETMCYVDDDNRATVIALLKALGGI